MWPNATTSVLSIATTMPVLPKATVIAMLSSTVTMDFISTVWCRACTRDVVINHTKGRYNILETLARGNDVFTNGGGVVTMINFSMLS